MDAPAILPEEESTSPHTEDLPKKSPLLTAHRTSGISLQDAQLDAQLDGPGDERSIPSDTKSLHIEKDMAKSPPKLPARGKGLSGNNLPSVPWGPPPAPAAKSAASTSTPTPTPPPRKLGMSFSWLRSTSASKDTGPTTNAAPAKKDRRDTVTSMASIASNPELMFTKLDEDDESDSSAGAKKQRNSLRDRFKMLRLREEAGIHSLEGQGQGASSPTASGGALAAMMGRSTSVGLGIGSPTSVADEKEGGLAVSSPLQSPVSTAPPTTDPNLAPGTASGVSAGPSAMKDPASPVDWDLWQTVVYEGPSAVAKTSAEELGMGTFSLFRSPLFFVKQAGHVQWKAIDVSNHV